MCLTFNGYARPSTANLSSNPAYAAPMSVYRGSRRAGSWLTFQLSRNRMTWKGRTSFPERLMMKMLCLSAHAQWATAQSKINLHVGGGGGGRLFVRGEGRSHLKQPPVDLIFNYMMKHLWGEDDGSVKPLHGPELRALANLAFIIRWPRRGWKWGASALWKDTTMVSSSQCSQQ